MAQQASLPTLLHWAGQRTPDDNTQTLSQVGGQGETQVAQSHECPPRVPLQTPCWPCTERPRECPGPSSNKDISVLILLPFPFQEVLQVAPAHTALQLLNPHQALPGNQNRRPPCMTPSGLASLTSQQGPDPGLRGAEQEQQPPGEGEHLGSRDTQVLMQAARPQEQSLCC